MLAHGDMKHCPRCDQDKPLDAFGVSRGRADGLTVYCKECRNGVQRKKYAEDNELRARKAAYRKQRLEDPEKYQRQLELQRKWYQEHWQDESFRDSENARTKRYSQTAHGRQRRQVSNRRWQAANRDRANKQHRNYVRDRYAKDPKFRRNLRDYYRRRRAMNRANGGEFDLENWQTLVDMTGAKCPKCGKKRRLELDHIKPVAEGGTSYLYNLQPLCRSCNASKGTSTEDYRTPAMLQWLDLVTD